MDQLIAELAWGQHGVVAVRQLLALRLSREAVARRVKAGRLHRVFTGVYAVGHRRLTTEGRYMAAVLACGEGALLSHRSAAAHWRIAPGAPGPIEVTVPGWARGPRGIRAHRTRRLAKGDAMIRNRIPVTSLPRTLIALGECLTERELTRAFHEAERLRLVDREDLRRRCATSRGRKGIGILRGLLSLPSLPLDGTRSRLEQRFVRFCHDRGLPLPVVNVPLGDLEVDCLWPAHRLVAELDSWAFHADRDAFERDRARDVAVQRMGYRTIRITARRLQRADELEADLRALLGLLAA